MRDRDYITEDPTRSDRRRFWCAYTDLEEYHAGMWKTVHGEEPQLRMIAKAVSVLGFEARFAAALSCVLERWPVSCLAEFTSPGNHLAWLGQAACCIDAGVPESLTRRAWWKLTEDEREKANAVARSAVSEWRNRWGKSYRGGGVTTRTWKSITQGCGAGFLGPTNERCLCAQLSLF